MSLAACGGLSTSQLASEAKADIQQMFAADPETRELRVLDVELVRESDRVDPGYVELAVLGQSEQERRSPRLTVDGDAFLWEIEN